MYRIRKIILIILIATNSGHIKSMEEISPANNFARIVSFISAIRMIYDIASLKVNEPVAIGTLTFDSLLLATSLIGLCYFTPTENKVPELPLSTHENHIQQ